MPVIRMGDGSGNLKLWVVDGDIRPYMPKVQGDSFRPRGGIRRSDNVKIERLPFLNWHIDGIGFDRISRDLMADGTVSGAMSDANADTRHRGSITLPHKGQAVTNPAPDDTNGDGNGTALGAWGNFQGEFIGAFQDIAGADPYQDVRSRVFQGASDTWTLGANIAGDTTGSRDAVTTLDLAVHKGAHYALAALENSAGTVDAEYSVATQATPAGSWSGTAASPGANAKFIDFTGFADRLTGIPNNGGYPLGLILDGLTTTREDLIVAIQEDADASGGSVNQTRVYHTVDVGANWVSTGNVPGRPRGKGIWNDPFTSGFPIVPVISTTDNLYIVDPANTSVVPVLPGSILSGQDDDGFGMVGSDGAYYVSTAVGDLVRVSFNDIGILSYPNIGPVTKVPRGGSGIVASRRGPVTAMASSPNFLYVAFQGATYSHIMCWSYEFQSWHSFYLGADTKKIYRMALSLNDDGVQRLHIAVDAGSTITLLQFEYPDESAASRTIVKDTTGFVELAEDDLGDPNTSSAIIQAVMDANNLSATTSGKYGSWFYGADGAAWTANDAGDFLSGDKDLVLGSGAGVSAKTLRNRIVLTSNNGAQDGPDIKDFEVQVKTKTRTLAGFPLVVDIGRTAAQRGNNVTAATVMTEILAMRDSVTFLPLRIDAVYGDMYVEVVDMAPAEIKFAQQNSSVDALVAATGGRVTLWVEEVI